MSVAPTSPSSPRRPWFHSVIYRPFTVSTALGFYQRHRQGKREITAGELPQWLTEAPDPLGFLLHESGASTIPDAAYRFVRHEPGVDVVLFGTGDPEHLRANILSILKPPLPEPDREQLAALFGRLVGVGLDAPHLSRPRS